MLKPQPKEPCHWKLVLLINCSTGLYMFLTHKILIRSIINIAFRCRRIYDPHTLHTITNFITYLYPPSIIEPCSVQIRNTAIFQTFSVVQSIFCFQAFPPLASDWLGWRPIIAYAENQTSEELRKHSLSSQALLMLRLNFCLLTRERENVLKRLYLTIVPSLIQIFYLSSYSMRYCH